MLKFTGIKAVVAITATQLALSALGVSIAAAQGTFVSPEEAVTALIGAVKTDGTAGIISVLGPRGADIADSGDAVADAARRAKFVTAFEEANKIERAQADRAVLVIGQDEFPFPIPLVSTDGKWSWDTAAGEEEILTRRIGENELGSIEVMRAYVDAQQEYAEVDRDGIGPQYARRLLSKVGKKDGLYWPASGDSDISPLGPLVAHAQEEGYGRESPAYHGYFYRILYSQGPSAKGGAQDYLVNGRMIGGFGLIASPAEYGNSGVMTFIVGDDGTIFQKDLGPDTGHAAHQISSFDPDSTWTKVD